MTPPYPEGQVLCPHCEFHMVIQIGSTSGPKINVSWVCVRCECKYSGDGHLTLYGIRTEVCSHTNDIGKDFA